MNRFALLVVFLLAGCQLAVPDKALETARTAAVGNDRYTALASKALDGSISAGLGLEAISKADLEASPSSVKRLLQALLESLHTNRFAWHSVVFQFGEGADPANMGLEQLLLPASESDELLNGSNSE